MISTHRAEMKGKGTQDDRTLAAWTCVMRSVACNMSTIKLNTTPPVSRDEAGCMALVARDLQQLVCLGLSIMQMRNKTQAYTSI